jgi:hypothetical protein
MLIGNAKTPMRFQVSIGNEYNPIPFSDEMNRILLVFNGGTLINFNMK